MSRYLLFRLLPVFAVTFFVAVSLRRAGLDPRFSSLSIAIVHGLLTNGRAMIAVLQRGARSFGYWAALSGHLAALVGMSLIAVIGVLAASQEWATALVPSLTEIAAVLWTSAIAAVAAAYQIRASSRGNYRSPAEVFQLARRTIPDDLWNAVGEIASLFMTDPTLVRAVMAAENLQRPRWVRRLEWLRQQLGWEGTYGIMQVRSLPPVTDLDSIRLACAGALRGASAPVLSENQYDSDWPRPFVALHNDDPEFIEMVILFHHNLRYDELRRGSAV